MIAGRYRLMALLGEGGMGAVYKAEHIRTGKVLAVKLTTRAPPQAVARLSSPHTVAVFDFGKMDGGFYLAMEYVPGADLATVLREQHRLTESRTISIGQQLLGSLAEAHGAGIVHGDVAPGNVMLRGGDVKVLDFAQAGTGEGTPGHFSPEQASCAPLDARSDLHQVGALLYELVSGYPPFVPVIALAPASAFLLPPRPLAGVSPAFAAVVHRALEKRPQDRFQSANEMRAALLGVGAQGTVLSPGPWAREQLDLPLLATPPARERTRGGDDPVRPKEEAA